MSDQSLTCQTPVRIRYDVNVSVSGETNAMLACQYKLNHKHNVKRSLPFKTHLNIKMKMKGNTLIQTELLCLRSNSKEILACYIVFMYNLTC